MTVQIFYIIDCTVHFFLKKSLFSCTARYRYRLTVASVAAVAAALVVGTVTRSFNLQLHLYDRYHTCIQAICPRSKNQSACSRAVVYKTDNHQSRISSCQTVPPRSLSLRVIDRCTYMNAPSPIDQKKKNSVPGDSYRRLLGSGGFWDRRASRLSGSSVIERSRWRNCVPIRLTLKSRD